MIKTPFWFRAEISRGMVLIKPIWLLYCLFCSCTEHYTCSPIATRVAERVFNLPQHVSWITCWNYLFFECSYKTYNVLFSMTPQFTQQVPLLRFCPVAGVQLESVGNVHAQVWPAHSGRFWDRIQVVCVLIGKSDFWKRSGQRRICDEQKATSGPVISVHTEISTGWEETWVTLKEIVSLHNF